MGEEKRRKRKTKKTSKLSNTYTNKVDNKASTPYVLKKKVMAIKVNKQANNGAKHIWVPKEIISNMKSTKKVWIPKGK